MATPAPVTPPVASEPPAQPPADRFARVDGVQDDAGRQVAAALHEMAAADDALVRQFATATIEEDAAAQARVKRDDAVSYGKQRAPEVAALGLDPERLKIEPEPETMPDYGSAAWFNEMVHRKWERVLDKVNDDLSQSAPKKDSAKTVDGVPLATDGPGGGSDTDTDSYDSETDPEMASLDREIGEFTKGLEALGRTHVAKSDAPAAVADGTSAVEQKLALEYEREQGLKRYLEQDVIKVQYQLYRGKRKNLRETGIQKHRVARAKRRAAAKAAMLPPEVLEETARPPPDAMDTDADADVGPLESAAAAKAADAKKAKRRDPNAKKMARIKYQRDGMAFFADRGPVYDRVSTDTHAGADRTYKLTPGTLEAILAEAHAYQTPSLSKYITPKWRAKYDYVLPRVTVPLLYTSLPMPLVIDYLLEEVRHMINANKPGGDVERIVADPAHNTAQESTSFFHQFEQVVSLRCPVFALVSAHTPTCPFDVLFVVTVPTQLATLDPAEFAADARAFAAGAQHAMLFPIDIADHPKTMARVAGEIGEKQARKGKRLNAAQKAAVREGGRANPVAAVPAPRRTDDGREMLYQFVYICGHVPCMAHAGGERNAPLDRCARCLTVRYCSPECQLADWPRHAPHCRTDAAEKSNLPSMIEHNDLVRALHKKKDADAAFAEARHKRAGAPELSADDRLKQRTALREQRMADTQQRAAAEVRSALASDAGMVSPGKGPPPAVDMEVDPRPASAPASAPVGGRTQ